MVKKKKQVVSVSEKWIDITSRIIEEYIEKNPTLRYSSRLRTNIAVCLYIIYDMLFKRHIDKDLRFEYFTINYHSLKNWSSLGNNFPKFFRFLLDKHIIQRWQSNNVNSKTGKKFVYYYHNKGVAGTCAQYKLNSKIIKVLENNPEVTISLDVSEKNDYFFHLIPKYKKKLGWWKNNDVYGDYREPNEYELKIMDRMKHIQVEDELVEGEIEPVFIHGRIYQNGWTNLSKEYRGKVKYKGKELGEVFDVPNCYVQFLATNIQNEQSISFENKKLFCYLAYTGKFYDHLVEGTEYSRNQIKPVWMHFLFCSSGTKKRGIANLRKFEGEETKKMYNEEYIAKFNLIKNKMKSEFPEVYEYLINYEEIELDGRKVSKLSVDLQWRENQKVLNLLMKRLEEKGIINEPISLHDGIYITVDQITDELKKKIKLGWNAIINKQFRTNKIERLIEVGE